MTIICSSQNTSNCEGFDKLKNYKVIGFGEACHGSYSDYLARADLIDCLIKNGDSINVLVEMPHAGGIAIEKYYKGEIDSDSLIKVVSYYGLQTNSFLDFINHFKKNGLVSFHGIDMQSHQNSLIYLKTSLNESNPKLDLTREIDSLNFNFLNGYPDSLFLDYLPVIWRNLDYLKNKLSKEGLTEKENYLTIVYPLNIIEQYFKIAEYVKKGKYFEYIIYRDSCLARNIISLIDFSRKQTVVLAANGHVMSNNNSKQPMMGGHLKNKFGKDYFVITSQYYQGTLLQVDIKEGQRVIEPKEIGPPFKKALPYKLNVLLHPHKDTLILVTSKNTQLKKLFKRRNYGQDMGTGSGNRKKSGLVFFDPKEYDAIFYIPNVKASKNIAN